jgi:hypothetical protein
LAHVWRPWWRWVACFPHAIVRTGPSANDIRCGERTCPWHRHSFRLRFRSGTHQPGAKDRGADRLRDHRLAAGLTLVGLAERVGIRRQWVSDYELGGRFCSSARCSSWSAR